jgi:hypothetical protein
VVRQAQGDDGDGNAVHGTRQPREGRQATAYTSGVRRRLRARVFHFVPKHRRTLLGVWVGLLLLAIGLIAADYLARVWEVPERLQPLANFFRLDQPAALVAYVRAQCFLIASLATALVFQLRRHRSDDYRGHYRLWRWIALLLLVASIDAATSMRGALGSLIELLLPQPPVIAGVEIIRMGLLFGGLALALVLASEIRQSRAALSLVGIVALCGVLPLLVGYGVLGTTLQQHAQAIDGWMRAALPLSVLAAVTTYLSFLYREARGFVRREEHALHARKERQRSHGEGNVRDRAGREAASRDGSEDERSSRRWLRWWGRRDQDRKSPQAQDAKARRRQAIDDADEEIAVPRPAATGRSSSAQAGPNLSPQAAHSATGHATGNGSTARRDAAAPKSNDAAATSDDGSKTVKPSKGWFSWLSLGDPAARATKRAARLEVKQAKRAAHDEAKKKRIEDKAFAREERRIKAEAAAAERAKEKAARRGTTPQSNPASSKPVTTNKPSTDRPSTDRPSTDRPSTEKPAGDRSTQEKGTPKGNAEKGTKKKWSIGSWLPKFPQLKSKTAQAGSAASASDGSSGGGSGAAGSGGAASGPVASRSGAGPVVGRREVSTAASGPTSAAASRNAAAAAQRANAAGFDDDDDDEDQDDSSHLSKAERKRLRKQQRRDAA